MNYQETLQWMFSQLPFYQNQGAIAYKANLDNTILLVNHLGNPENKIKTIHVAGTNGKGSTSSMISSILQEAGYKVGLYTSPHLKDFRERIKINGEMISQDFVVNFIATNKSFFEKNQLSFFEMTVGLALDYFVKASVDVAVIEVGMGGRLDSTNIITPLISVITNIDLDHTQFLGNTIKAIAGEKAGIIKPNIPVVIGEYTQETRKVFLEKANKTKSQIFFASDAVSINYESDLQGDYQFHNKKSTLQTIQILKSSFNINSNHIKQGFLNVTKNTGLLGRWQQIQENPRVICDTAHNSHGLKIALNQIKKYQYDNLFFVLGVVNDKDLDEILPLFPKNATYFFSKPNIFRGLDPIVLQQNALQFDLIGKVYDSVSAAYAQAIEEAKNNDFIYIGGSTFVVAEIL
jgi:dihydrofolate synthase / folylpolyglutamate synthase